MSNSLTILCIAVPSPLRHSFDYLPPKDWDGKPLSPGIRLKVPFGKREIIGILLSTTTKSQIDPNKLKPAIAILDEIPLLSEKLMQLNIWISNYYHHPIGEVILNSFPQLLRRGKYLSSISVVPTQRRANDYSPLQLNIKQQQAIAQISQSQGFNTFLLDGVTGSGKTEVYLQVIENIIQEKQALILVPEIGLTPQTIARFQERFAVPIAILHSKLTPKERLNNWLMAKAGIAKIIIGTRSAIFTPIKTLGIIIIDEEHDLSFKQQSGLRYSARDIAVMRGKLENVPVVLGSATPSLESLYNVDKKNYQRLHLPERAGNAIHPDFHLIDMRNQKFTAGLSEQLIQKIQQHLTQAGQVLLFLNRRGYAPVLLCHNCGWTAECSRCDAKMTLHQKPKYLHCHHCGTTKPVSTVCPSCNSKQIISMGLGTERVEETLTNIFPDTPLIRIDRDTTRRKGSMQKMLTDIQNNNCQILIGTQMLAKGHHFPNITMSAIINADSGLLSSDFRAQEHMAQLIIQVAGRAGRAEKPGEVYIQTYNPHHPLLLTLIEQGYHAFTIQNLTERKNAALPPYNYFALIRAEAKNTTAALQFLEQLKQTTTLTNIQLLGPIPAPMQRKAGFYRAQLLLSSKSRNNLRQSLNALTQYIETSKAARKVRWSLDVDPLDMF